MRLRRWLTAWKGASRSAPCLQHGDAAATQYQRLRQRFPKVSVHILEGMFDVLVPMLRTSDLDILLGRLPRLAGDEGIATETLYHEPTSVVARPGHPLVQRDIAVQDLREASWILPSRRTLLRAEIDEAFRAIGQPPPKPMLESVTVLVNQRFWQTRTCWLSCRGTSPNTIAFTISSRFSRRRFGFRLRRSGSPSGRDIFPVPRRAFLLK